MKVRVIEEFFSGMGCCARPKMGSYTLGRLGKNAEGEYLFHCVEGEAVSAAALVRGRRWPCRSTLRSSFMPDGSTEALLERVLAQHFAVVPGRWRNAVVEFARLANIDLI